MAESRSRGFTLIEGLASLAIATTVTALAVPTLSFMFQRAQQAAALAELAGGLQRARNLAIRSGQTVSFCPSRDGKGCSREQRPDWALGWILFRDPNADMERAPEEEVLNRFAHLHPSFRLIGSGGLERGGGFRRTGDALRPGLLDYCAGNGEGQRLTILESGQWHMEPLPSCPPQSAVESTEHPPFTKTIKY